MIAKTTGPSMRRRHLIMKGVPLAVTSAAIFPLLSCRTSSLITGAAHSPTFDQIPAGVKAEIKAWPMPDTTGPGGPR